MGTLRNDQHFDVCNRGGLTLAALLWFSLLGCSTAITDASDAPSPSGSSLAQVFSAQQQAEIFRRNQELIDQQRREIELLKQHRLEY